MDYDLQTLIDNYQPSAETKNLVATHPLVLVAGISGAGKDTIARQLVVTGKYQQFVSHTTRPPRINDGRTEVNGQDYYFIDQQQAEAMIIQQEFIEVKLVHGTIYGSSVAEFQKAVDSHKIPINNVDVQGVNEYKQLSDRVTALFVLPPSYEIWLERLKKRYSTEADFAINWPKRRGSAIRELEFALNSKQFEWVINDDLAQVVQEADRLISNQAVDFATPEQKQIAKQILYKLQTAA